MTDEPTIVELLANMRRGDPCVAGKAGHAILRRHGECAPHIHELIALLRCPSAAIADYAYRTIEHLGPSAAPPLLESLPESHGDLRHAILGLIATVASFSVSFPLLKTELADGDRPSQYWAANCLCRIFSDQAQWPPAAIATLKESIVLLAETKADSKHWRQARIALKHLGQVPPSAG